MRILHTVSVLGFGGREERVLETAAAQAQAGHEVWIAAPPGSATLLCARDAGLPGVALDFGAPPVDTNREGGGSRRDRALRAGDAVWTRATLAALRALRRLLRRLAIELVDAHGTRDGRIAPACLDLAAVIRTVHHLGAGAGPVGRLGWRAFDQVVATARVVRDELLAARLASPARSTVIGEWASDRFFAPTPDPVELATLRASLGLDPQPIVATFGVMRAEKGFEHLVQALALLRASGVPAQGLVVGGANLDVGDRSGYVRGVEELAATLGVADRVCFTGFRTDVAALMHLADLVVVPSLREAQTRVVPQSLACGRPVLAYATGGIPEIVEHGKTGWLAPTGDVIALAEQIRRILGAGEERGAIGAQAREFAESRLRVASGIAATLAVYEQALARARRRRPAARWWPLRGDRDSYLTAGPQRSREPARAASLPGVSPFAGRHVLLLAAHPDDEILGAGGQLAGIRRISLVHLTDGAPSRAIARLRGLPTRRAYAALRQAELSSALAAGGINADRFALGYRDQHAAFHLVEAAERMALLIERLAPDLILTHPYEGGHPDHDAAAFVARTAGGMAARPIPLWEMTSYHAERESLRSGFLPDDRARVIELDLDPDERLVKLRMLACFGSQRHVVEAAEVGVERFRPAPEYDFGAPPHPGRLLYEERGWAMTGRAWRQLAVRAERAVASRVAKRSHLARIPIPAVGRLAGEHERGHAELLTAAAIRSLRPSEGAQRAR
ncbi:MAG TPA: glycosyltransferase [Candidatus Bathyarchaeia archaeon]|nr:glycosyltransferase [Candidatus Bathyarchaeia archaeon]